MAEVKNYSDDSIKELDDIQHIQLRPSMYIGPLGKPGLYKLDCEPIQNVLDEAMAGYGDHCNIILNTKENIFTIEDFGRSIPAGKLKKIFSKQHVGAKFDNDTYHRHSGSNGVGLKVLMALSDWLECEVYGEAFTNPDGTVTPARYARVEFANGKLIGEDLKDLPNGIPAGKHRGTTISYKSSERLMHTTEHDIPRICDLCNNIAYQTPGFKFNFTVDGKTQSFVHTGGMKEQMKDFIHRKSIKCLIEPIEFSGDEPTFDYHIMFTYNPQNSGDSNVISYVNGNTTPGHGFHVSSFKKGAGLAITQYINENPTIVPKQFQKLSVTGALINDNIVAIVGVGHEDPNYDNQMKDALKSIDVQVPIEKATRTLFLKWLHEHPKEAKRLVDLAIDYAKYEEERKKLKKNLVDSKQTKSIFDSNSIDPTKYKTCRSKDPTKNELFIVEGQSAGGGISAGRDSNFQALYMLTGKILNVAKTGVKSNLSKVILDLVQISGMGLPVNGKPKYESRAFDKFIILTDADDDGAHIVTLLLAFFYTFYPKIIEEGHVYVANPPLKQLIMQNGQSFFINTEADYDRLMKEYIVNTFEMYASKTKKKLSEGLFRAYIDANNGYNNIMDNHAAALAIDPSLLEMICINITDVSSATDNDNNPANKSFYQKTGFKIHRVPGTDLITFDRGIMHANLKFDELFLNEHFDPIVAKLNEIAICDIYLKGIKSGHEYHGTIYQLNKIMSGILGNKVNIKRYKGLGEMASDELIETVINPVTRSISKVTMEQAEKAEKAMKIFMTDTDIAFKRLFYAGKVEFN